MRVEYSNRALADLRKVAADSVAYGDVVATAVEARIREIVAQIADLPDRAPSVADRPGVRAVLLLSYPYKLLAHSGRSASNTPHPTHVLLVVVADPSGAHASL